MFVNCLYITFYSADDGGKLEDFAMDTEVEAFRKLEREIRLVRTYTSPD